MRGRKPELHALYLLTLGSILCWPHTFSKQVPRGVITAVPEESADLEVSASLVRLFCHKGWVQEITTDSCPRRCAVLTQAGATNLRQRARGQQVYQQMYGRDGDYHDACVAYTSAVFAAVEQWEEIQELIYRGQEDRGKILTFPPPVEVHSQA